MKLKAPTTTGDPKLFAKEEGYILVCNDPNTMTCLLYGSELVGLIKR